MELIAVAKDWRSHARVLAAGFVVAVAIGVLISYSVSLGLPPRVHSRQTFVGEASAQVLIDTPNSQIADVASSAQSATLYTQASLLADLMGTAPVQDEIASQLGIASTRLAVVPPPASIVVPLKATPLGVAGAKAATASSPWQLTITQDPVLPIIAFAAQGPTPYRAGQLATAAMSALRERLDAIDLEQNVPTHQRTVVNVIGPPLTGWVSHGPRKLYGLAAAVVVFGLFCFALVIVEAKRRRRAAASSVFPEGVHLLDPDGAETAGRYDQQLQSESARAGVAE